MLESIISFSPYDFERRLFAQTHGIYRSFKSFMSQMNP